MPSRGSGRRHGAAAAARPAPAPCAVLPAGCPHRALALALEVQLPSPPLGVQLPSFLLKHLNSNSSAMLPSGEGRRAGRAWRGSSGEHPRNCGPVTVRCSHRRSAASRASCRASAWRAPGAPLICSHNPMQASPCPASCRPGARAARCRARLPARLPRRSSGSPLPICMSPTHRCPKLRACLANAAAESFQCGCRRACGPSPPAPAMPCHAMPCPTMLAASARPVAWRLWLPAHPPAGGPSSTDPNVGPPGVSLMSAGYASTTKGGISGKRRDAPAWHGMARQPGAGAERHRTGSSVWHMTTRHIASPTPTRRLLHRLGHRHRRQAAGRQQDRHRRAGARPESLGLICFPKLLLASVLQKGRDPVPAAWLE